MNPTTNVTINGLEAVADAIMLFEGFFAHQNGQLSMANRNRNPGNLELPDGQKRVYGSLAEGYADLVRDLHGKFSGNNAHNLGQDSSLLDLFMVYAPSSDHNPTLNYCNFVASWCTMALNRTITSGSRLKDIWKYTLTIEEATST